MNNQIPNKKTVTVVLYEDLNLKNADYPYNLKRFEAFIAGTFDDTYIHYGRTKEDVLKSLKQAIQRSTKKMERREIIELELDDGGDGT